MSSRFERTGSTVVHEGKVLTLSVETFRHEDGEEVTREVARHQGAVAVVAHDDEHVYLVRQPREAIGVPDFLEIPAGKLDVEDEPPLETAKRELAEEIGKAAADWEEIASFYTTAGFSDELIRVYLATGLSDVQAETEENERIDIVTHPLADLDALIDANRDAKTLIGLLELRRRRAAAPPA
jgi:8-oxo-dGTP pyrophosphatase MutT (NUDIX family)